ncbi:MAG TPA: hypothetical protein PLX15_03230 [Candidatus Woesearchaeota archaeon]|nr:hypothetical protein [Candidatus Woesearchaeota archaeon]
MVSIYELGSEVGVDLTPYEVCVKYSAKFKGYNSRIILNKSMSKIEFRLSKSFNGVDEDICLGLYQTLIARLFKKKVLTLRMEIFERFIKNIHSNYIIENSFSDLKLKDSFSRVNERFFNGSMSIRRVCFGKQSYQTLGKYDFNSDEITVSAILKNEECELIDFIMYHEMLHKKHGFGNFLKRSYHNRQFRDDEKKFPNYRLIDKKLGELSRRKRREQKKGLKRFFD